MHTLRACPKNFTHSQQRKPLLHHHKTKTLIQTKSNVKLIPIIPKITPFSFSSGLWPKNLQARITTPQAPGKGPAIQEARRETPTPPEGSKKNKNKRYPLYISQSVHINLNRTFILLINYVGWARPPNCKKNPPGCNQHYHQHEYNHWHHKQHQGITMDIIIDIIMYVVIGLVFN